ncbi:MAG: C40 family peptidase [Rhodobiaceae bacterium]|nr:C40 family peptidase [Rhodobiaceae bacterium]MCC0051077.1 C40 family peptidase [Rhodobiaceae bacterium]MCC0060076.1 C40 family peptidase [Rhodobiaceae bacterium]
MSDMRERIVAEAKSWLGTPYHHRASRKGAGADCLGLLRGVWRACIGDEPLAVPPYTGSWADAGGGEPLLIAARSALIECRSDAILRPGDVIVFRVGPANVAKHAGIAIAPDRMIHAWEAAGVVETRLAPWWTRRVAGVFAFPGCSEEI